MESKRSKGICRRPDLRFAVDHRVLVFLAFPMVASLYYSFTQYDIPKPAVGGSEQLHQHVQGPLFPGGALEQHFTWP